VWGEPGEVKANPFAMPLISSSFFVLRFDARAQPYISLLVKIGEEQEIDKIVSRCFLWSGISFNISKNNMLYQSMFEVVATIGPGYKAPTYDELRGHLLQQKKSNCTCKLDELRESWEIIGWSMMLCGWIHGKVKTILNFLVY
jgi:hypothetical protein